MLRLRVVSLMLLFTGAASGCVATTTTSRTWTAPGAQWGRPGHVDWVREVIQRQEGNPAAGALAGAIIGGILLGGGRGPGALIGAAGGAIVGAAASEGGAERRFYEVAVRFEDGGFQVFVYEGHSPFGPGESVVQTGDGLFRR